MCREAQPGNSSGRITGTHQFFEEFRKRKVDASDAQLREFGVDSTQHPSAA
jgi:hypothetical protein